VAEAKAARPP